MAMVIGCSSFDQSEYPEGVMTSSPGRHELIIYGSFIDSLSA